MKGKRSKKKPRVSYTEKMEFIRPLVSFDYKRPERISSTEKAKLTRYYNFAHGVARHYKPVHVDPKHFKKIQEDVNPNFRRIKGVKDTDFSVIFAPVDRPNIAKTKDGKYVFGGGTKETAKRRREVVEFPRDKKSRKEFAKDPAAFVSKFARGYPKNARFRWYNSQGWSPMGRFRADSIGDAVERFADTDSGDGLEGFIEGLYVDFE